MNRHTNTIENIAFPRTTYVVDNNITMKTFLTGCHGVDSNTDDHDESDDGADGENDLYFRRPFHIEAVHYHQWYCKDKKCYNVLLVS